MSADAPKDAFIVVDGRRWRASDPGIPANLRQELVNELMAARRAVRDARNDREIRRSRGRVNDAKIALGERGHPWWLAPEPTALTRRVDAALSALLRSRGAGKMVAPAEIARIAAGREWRALLPAVRECAVKMSESGAIEILRKNRVVTTDPTRGVLRYRLK